MNLGYSSKFPWGGLTQFEEYILSGRKKHTIRIDLKGRWKAGRIIHHVMGNRTKQRREFLRGECHGTQIVKMFFDLRGKIECLKVDGREIPDWEKVAFNDGLTIIEFEKWFNENSTDDIFEGTIIHFTDLRY
jgi:hypothetical protein